MQKETSSTVTHQRQSSPTQPSAIKQSFSGKIFVTISDQLIVY